MFGINLKMPWTRRRETLEALQAAKDLQRAHEIYTEALFSKLRAQQQGCDNARRADRVAHATPALLRKTSSNSDSGSFGGSN